MRITILIHRVHSQRLWTYRAQVPHHIYFMRIVRGLMDSPQARSGGSNAALSKTKLSVASGHSLLGSSTLFKHLSNFDMAVTLRQH
jgi:hypothetical protein